MRTHFTTLTICLSTILLLANSRADTNTLSQEGSAKGHLVDSQGHSIPGAKIGKFSNIKGDTAYYNGLPPDPKYYPYITDSNGDFVILPQENEDKCAGVQVVAPGYARKHFWLNYDNSVQDLYLDHGATVTGRLIKDGKPVPNIQVGIAQVSRSCDTFIDEIIATTDQEGRFALKDVAAYDSYEIHGKRDSLESLGVTGIKLVKTGAPDSTISVGDLVVEPGIKVTGRLICADGSSLPPSDNFIGYQLHVQPRGPVDPDDGVTAYDYQYLNLKSDRYFQFLARDKESLDLYADVQGYDIQSPDRMVTIIVTPDLKPVDIKYVPHKEAILPPVDPKEIKAKASYIPLMKSFPSNTVADNETKEWIGKAEQFLKENPDTKFTQEVRGRIKELQIIAALKTKPLELKFTALDGRNVDLEKLRGKVVLIDFWATWCGPCRGEIPEVMQTYQKLHDQGFEIVGISLDKKQDKLESFLKEKGMPWPQYFDGKDWKNSISSKFGINSIPTMWLVNKQGLLISSNARGDLENQVTKLLAEQPIKNP